MLDPEASQIFRLCSPCGTDPINFLAIAYWDNVRYCLVRSTLNYSVFAVASLAEFQDLIRILRED